jgi:steroid 5-alpha reductase family enzyme
MTTLSTSPHTLHKAFGLVITAYLLALGAAVFTWLLCGALNPLLSFFIADVAATLVIYLFGRMFRNASFYDPYWSVAPPVIALFWFFKGVNGGAIGLSQPIVLVLVLLWGLRLTFNWARSWRGLQHEDWRYRDMREKSPRLFWLIDLVGIELMPTVLVFAGCLSLYPVFVEKQTFEPLHIIAIIVTAGAILIETAADEQLRRFALRRQPGQIMASGLWAYSRHPNYFGEVLFWWGLFLCGLAADPAYWWTIIGPLAITLLFLFISIPLMEKRSLASRPGYAKLQKKVSAIFPWFPGK